MITIIRISGKVNLNKKIEESFNRLRLRKKYTCVVIRENPEVIKEIRNIRNFAAYGIINEETLIKLIKFRGKLIGNSKKKIDNPDKITKDFLSGKKLSELGIKPFFGLHPPRGGMKSAKLHYPRGVLGNQGDDINKLIDKML